MMNHFPPRIDKSEPVRHAIEAVEAQGEDSWMTIIDEVVDPAKSEAKDNGKKRPLPIPTTNTKKATKSLPATSPPKRRAAAKALEHTDEIFSDEEQAITGNDLPPAKRRRLKRVSHYADCFSASEDSSEQASDQEDGSDEDGGEFVVEAILDKRIRRGLSPSLLFVEIGFGLMLRSQGLRSI